MFDRLEAWTPHAYARGWVADRAGIFDDSRRGYGGQSRTAVDVFEHRMFDQCDTFGWITAVRSSRSGSSRAVILELLDKMADRGAQAVGLMVVPDEDEFIERLTRYYERLGFRIIGEAAYPIMTRPLVECARKRA